MVSAVWFGVVSMAKVRVVVVEMMQSIEPRSTRRTIDALYDPECLKPNNLSRHKCCTSTPLFPFSKYRGPISTVSRARNRASRPRHDRS